MFINYFRDETRNSPLNLAAARVVLGGWLLWKMIWYDWSRFVETPYRAAGQPAWEWAIPTTMPWLLTVEKWVLIGLLVLFILGYRIRLTAALSALIAAHLGTVRFTLIDIGETEAIFIGVMMFLFFALYAEYDRLSIDEFCRTAAASREALATDLAQASDRPYRLPQMKYALLILATIYFGSGVDKLINGSGFGFAAPDNLARIITIRAEIYAWDYDIAMLLVDHPILSAAAGLGTLIIETGFLLVVVAGLPITLFALGLVGFTITNYVALGILFADTLAFVTLFFSFDCVHARLSPTRDLEVVFDDTSRSVMQLLRPFDHLDAAGRIQWHPHEQAPAWYREESVPIRGIVLRDGETIHQGFDAISVLLDQYAIFRPITLLLALGPIRRTVERRFGGLAGARPDVPPQSGQSE